MKKSKNPAIDQLKLLNVLFKDMSNLLINLGKAELRSPETDFFSRLSSDSIRLMNEFSENLTPEELGHFMKLLIKLTGHTQNLANFMQLTPEEKIVVGDDIKKLANDTLVLITQIMKRTCK